MFVFYLLTAAKHLNTTHATVARHIEGTERAQARSRLSAYPQQGGSRVNTHFIRANDVPGRCSSGGSEFTRDPGRRPSL
ncbi:hypothetical protein D3C84_1021680 [compost metagenome]